MPQEAVPQVSFDEEQTLRRLAYVASLGQLTAEQYESLRPEFATLSGGNAEQLS